MKMFARARRVVCFHFNGHYEGILCIIYSSRCRLDLVIASDREIEKFQRPTESLSSRSFTRYLRFLLPFQVSKSCASSEECGPASVGCIPVDTQQVRNSEFCRVPGGRFLEQFKRGERQKTRETKKRKQKKKRDNRNAREKYRRNRVK